MSPTPTPKPYVQSGDPLKEFLPSFWRRQIDEAEQENPDYRHPPLPLARIKKVMKSDPDVKMIAADAPVIFCKACEIFISEITARAFIIADANKRRTLSRADIAKALSKSDQFDFLIDFMPREDSSQQQHQQQQGAPSPGGGGTGGAGGGGAGGSNSRGNHGMSQSHSAPALMAARPTTSNEGYNPQRPPLRHSDSSNLGMGGGGDSDNMLAGDQGPQMYDQLESLLQQGPGRNMG